MASEQENRIVAEVMDNMKMQVSLSWHAVLFPGD